MKTNRRNFMKSAAVSAAGLYFAESIHSFGQENLTPARSVSASSVNTASGTHPNLIWANLLHLGRNMWGDTNRAYTPPAKKFDCDISLWNELTKKMADSGLNMIVIDLGEAVLYQSHPELAVDGAWTVKQLRQELQRLRGIGLEPIPKLNFSACHDFWLGEYARMLSTKKYYDVCRDLIQEVCEIFDKPRFFHLGYDEENYGNQKTYDYVVIRQGELWWNDFLFFVKTVEKEQVRPWIWSDYYWHHPEEFMKRMPKSVLQSNWYYGDKFGLDIPRVKAYVDFEKAGFDQIPTGSNWSNDVNFKMTVDFCRKNISKEHLLGFLQTPWHFTFPKDRDYHLRAIEQVKSAVYQ